MGINICTHTHTHTHTYIYIYIYIYVGFPGILAGKESACNVGDLSSIPGLGRCPRERNGYPLQCSGLEISMGCIVLGVTKGQTCLCNFHLFYIYILYMYIDAL